MKYIIRKKVSAAFLFSVASLVFAGCSSPENNAGQPAPVAVPIHVTVQSPSSGSYSTLDLSGQIEAGRWANISTRLMGYITKVFVKAGDHVTSGQLLVSISNKDILAKKAEADAAITAASAAAANAKKDLDRYTTLYNQQSATAKELENVTLQYTAASSRLEAARQMRNEVDETLSYASLRAPFAGTVSQKLADEGSMANPGMPILTVEQEGNFQVTAMAPESEISSLKQGMKAIVFIKALERTIDGAVAEINTSSRFSGGQYLVKISIPAAEQNGLYAGMYVRVAVALPAKDTGSSGGAVTVPVSGIVSRDQLKGIYTVGSNHTALLRWLRLGKTYGDRVEVLSGLAADEQFIAHADGRLYDGAPVSVTP